METICVSTNEGEKLLKEVAKKGYVIDYRMQFYTNKLVAVTRAVTATVQWYSGKDILSNEPFYKFWVMPAK